MDDASAGTRILIIEDYPSASIALTSHFKRAGWEPIALTSGFQAVEHIHSGAVPPEAILIDIMIPGPSGIDVIQLIRDCGVKSRKTGKPVRIVVYTGCNPTDEAVGMAIQCGADAVIIKPATFEKTLAVITGEDPGDIAIHHGTSTDEPTIP